ncbi:MAG: hypothetical protein ACJAZ3_001372 [Sphingobacteriales bacterium]|jgi:hypothetical protein
MNTLKSIFKLSLIIFLLISIFSFTLFETKKSIKLPKELKENFVLIETETEGEGMPSLFFMATKEITNLEYNEFLADIRATGNLEFLVPYKFMQTSGTILWLICSPL